MGDASPEANAPGSPTRSLLRNAGAYLLRGLATGVASLALPALLLRALPNEIFLVWVLVVQIATYVSLLESGLQVSVGRFIAQESARQEVSRRDAYYFAGVILLIACAAIGLIATVVISATLPIFFPKLPSSELGEARLALIWVGGAAAIALPASAATGVFIGLEQNKIPAMLIGGGRILQCLFTAGVAYRTHSLIPTSITYAAFTCVICLAQFVAVVMLGPKLRLHRPNITSQVFRDLSVNALTLSLWTVSMLLISGLDIPIVARFDFIGVAPYSFAASLISVFVGFASLAFNALLPRSSALAAIGKADEVRVLMINSTRICAGIVVLSGILGYALCPVILQFWVGKQMEVQAVPLVRLLILANAIRMLLVPFALILVGTGRQWLAGLTPIAEGVANVAVSIILAWKFGAAGVAVGTIVGAAIGVALAVGYAMPRAAEVSCRPSEFLSEVVLKIGGLAIPWVLVFWAWESVSASAKILGVAAAAILSAILLTRFVLNRSELGALAESFKRLARFT